MGDLSFGQLVGLGAISAGGSLLSNLFNIAQTNKWNKIAMERQDNAIQRQVADMKAAGINPLMSSSFSGSQTGTYTPPVFDTNVMSEYLQGRLEQEQLKQQKLITAQQNHYNNMLRAQEGLLAIDLEKARYNMDFFKGYGDYFDPSTNGYTLFKNQIEQSNYQSELLRKQNEWYNAQQIQGWINTGLDAAGTVMGGFNTYAKVGQMLNGNLPQITDTTVTNYNRYGKPTGSTKTYQTRHR